MTNAAAILFFLHSAIIHYCIVMFTENLPDVFMLIFLGKEEAFLLHFPSMI